MRIKRYKYFNQIVGLIFILSLYSCETNIPQVETSSNTSNNDNETIAIVKSIGDFKHFNHNSEIYVLNIEYYIGDKLVNSSIVSS